jgi:hypothetical protein
MEPTCTPIDALPCTQALVVVVGINYHRPPPDRLSLAIMIPLRLGNRP